jgi:hypothetical protein
MVYSINIEGLAKGMYFVRVQNEEMNHVVSVIVE